MKGPQILGLALVMAGLVVTVTSEDPYRYYDNFNVLPEQRIQPSLGHGPLTSRQFGVDTSVGVGGLVRLKHDLCFSRTI